MRAVLLGSSAVCTAERDYSSLAIEGEGEVLLLDCCGSPIKNLLRARMNPADLHTILVSHHHADHIYALPIIIYEMMLRGIEGPLEVFCPEQAEGRLRAILDSSFGDEPKIPSLKIEPLKTEALVAIPVSENWEVFSAPADHYDATLAYRIANRDGRSYVYAPDTRPCKGLIEFACGADVLIHDCTYPDGFEFQAEQSHHSTASQAGEVAREAGVRKLVLAHFGLECTGRENDLLNSAKRRFDGEVVLGRDLLPL